MLLKHELFVKAERCEFHQRQVSFLGYVTAKDRIEMDPEKVQAVIPIPSSRMEVQRFLGFMNFYRKFIRNCSAMATPLSGLTSPKVSFQWSSATENALQHLKTSFATAPVLILPSPDLQFIMEMDASDSRIGAILSQRAGTDNKVHPSAFLSRKLTPVERNYSGETGSRWR